VSTLLVLGIALALAFANGGNDQFKGVATLYGSGVTSYRKALLWATVTAAFGALGVFAFGGGLLAAFSGKGLVPDSVVALRSFSVAVGIGAAGAVLLATRFKLPVSTTHALVGALFGVGLVASPVGGNFDKLQNSFLIPLLFSPVLALVLFLGIYPILHFARLRFGVSRETCVCIGEEVLAIAPAGVSVAQARQMILTNAFPTVTVDSAANCEDRYQGNLLGVKASTVVDSLHFLSAGSVCFARAMNDVPKMAALLLISGIASPTTAILGIAVLMLVGGLVQSKKIAETMSKDVTEMNPGQGFTANLVTSGIVLFSSKLGLPVSTTHVACGSIFGLGAVNRTLQVKTLKKILLAWVVTLPLSALLGYGAFLVLNGRI
jgi:PiT family inorganic phosphate transporter